MLNFDWIPDSVPEGFSLELEETDLKISYWHITKYPFILLIVGFALSQSQLKGLPASVQQLFNPKLIPQWALSYPENLIWLGPLGHMMFTFASLTLIYCGIALLINKNMLEISEQSICSYDHPLPLSRRYKTDLEQIETVRWEKRFSGTGSISSLSYPVYLRLKNGQLRPLISFDREIDARFLHKLLNDYLNK